MALSAREVGDDAVQHALRHGAEAVIVMVIMKGTGEQHCSIQGKRGELRRILQNSYDGLQVKLRSTKPA